MIACLKKEIVDSAFTNYFKLVTNYQINTRRFATQKGVSLSINWEYPAVEAKMTNSLPAFEFTIYISCPPVLTSSIKISNIYQEKIIVINGSVKWTFCQWFSNSSGFWLRDLQLQIKNTDFIPNLISVTVHTVKAYRS